MDHNLARIIALLASILALLLATMIHKTYNPGHINSLQPTLHPEYVRCMEMRVEAIERMLAEKIITNHKATLFTKRAAALCGTQFPSP